MFVFSFTAIAGSVFLFLVQGFFLWGWGLIWGGYFGIPYEPTVITLKELYKISNLVNAVLSKN